MLLQALHEEGEVGLVGLHVLDGGRLRDVLPLLTYQLQFVDELVADLLDEYIGVVLVLQGDVSAVQVRHAVGVRALVASFRAHAARPLAGGALVRRHLLVLADSPQVDPQLFDVGLSFLAGV